MVLLHAFHKPVSFFILFANSLNFKPFSFFFFSYTDHFVEDQIQSVRQSVFGRKREVHLIK